MIDWTYFDYLFVNVWINWLFLLIARECVDEFVDCLKMYW